jgi:hypothetical protein
MRVNGVRRTLIMRRFEEERSRGTAGLEEMITDTLLPEATRPHDDYHYRHDKHGIDRVPKYPLAQVPMGSPRVTV